jgi:hypothetical protein
VERYSTGVGRPPAPSAAAAAGLKAPRVVLIVFNGWAVVTSTVRTPKTGYVQNGRALRGTVLKETLIRPGVIDGSEGSCAFRVGTPDEST